MNKTRKTVRESKPVKAQVKFRKELKDRRKVRYRHFQAQPHIPASVQPSIPVPIPASVPAPLDNEATINQRAPNLKSAMDACDDHRQANQTSELIG
jgi:hypothetical protein